MSISAINHTNLFQNSDNSSNRVPTKTLTQQDFLKLLITQLTTQDPLNPMKDTEFVAQMVQFSMLEQNKSMQDIISAMNSGQKVVQANSMLGKTVKVIEDNSIISTGVVSSVVITDGEPRLVVNGNLYSLDRVMTISPEQPGNQTK